MQTFIYVVHFLVCFILIGVVLLQRGKGQDLGASLGGGSANTIFGSRGAGNFLTRITTASAIIFMGTSLTLSYLGYKSSDVRLFDESEPFVPETGGAPKPETSGLEEIPAAAADSEGADAGALVEVPSEAVEAEAVPAAEAASAAPATNAAPAPEATDGAPAEAAPAAEATPPADAAGAPAAEAPAQP
jgi:preprotein translocase subunit SecG